MKRRGNLSYPSLTLLALTFCALISGSLLINSCSDDILPLSKGPDSKGFALSPGPNLVSNPSFETNTTGWTGWQSSITRESVTGAPNGSFAVKVTRTTGTSFTVDDEPPTIASTTTGQKYWASVWVRAASTSSQGKNVTLRLREINSSGVLVKETISPGIVLTNTFQQLFVTVTAASGGNTLDMRISQTGAATGDAFYADQFELRVAPPQNLVTNPSFEANLSGWMGWQSSLSRVAIASPDGDYVVKVTRTSGTSYTVDDDPASVQATISGNVYSASAWVASASSSSVGKSVTLRMREINSSGGLVQEVISSSTTLSNTFKRLTVNATAIGDGNTLDVRISQTSATSGDAFYADYFVMEGEEGTPPPVGDPAEKRPFDPEHPVYQPIPPNCPLYQYSSQIVSNIAANYTKINFDDKQESPPIYTGQTTDPIWRVTIAGKQFNVHAPSNMSPGTGSDYPLIILDRSSPDYNGHPVEYRMWRAVLNKNTNPWTITNQGGGVGVYANDGQILNDIDIQTGMVPRALGQAEIHGQNTGSGCSYTVGMIRPIDIQRGHIDHAIRVAIGYPHPTRSFWPALRTETWNIPANNNMAPMGARIFIDHNVDIEALGNAVAARLSDPKNKAFAKMVVKAMQEYGFIALDGSENNNVYMEGRNTADWVSLIGQRNAWDSYGDIGRAIEQELNYNTLRVADPSVFNNYGK